MTDDEIRRAIAEKCNPLALTLIEATVVLATLDICIPGFPDNDEDKIHLQAARDRIYLAIPEDFRDALPEEPE